MKQATTLAIVLVAFTFAKIVSAKPCFPGNTWINCLLNTCTIYKKCPGDPSATCTIKRTECGCEANWYKPTGEKANCDVRKKYKICPGGERTVDCKVDLCKWTCNHPDFLNAPCRQNNCGQCTAEYFVKEKWIWCPTIIQDTGEELAPTHSVISPANPGVCNPVPCNIKICIDEKCPLEPRAVCRPDGCNECKPAWYLDNVRVQCYKGGGPIVSSKDAVFIAQSTCAAGENPVPCDQSVCDQQICRNYPNAICKPDGCGECKATWYVDGKLVDCLSEECPPDVPFVKCIDDPCKYFGHYCPQAECRATQCGSCKAQFFANGVEIDCAMPPKTCPAGVQPLNCQWFTCPSNICPSNNRLMCRIDPCGRTCRHDWVDIYNGEVMTCRTFDGDGRTIKTDRKSEKIFMTDPLAKFFDAMGSEKSATGEDNSMTKSNTFPQPKHPVSVITGNAMQGSNQNGPEMQTKADVIVSRGPGRFRVEPIFMTPRQVLSTADLHALLRAFDYEWMGISSMSIQNALRNEQLSQTPATKPLFSPNAKPFAQQQIKRKVSLPVSKELKLTSSSDPKQPIIAHEAPRPKIDLASQNQPIINQELPAPIFTGPSVQTQAIAMSMPLFDPGRTLQNANFIQENEAAGDIVKPKRKEGSPIKASGVTVKDKNVVPVDQIGQNPGQVNPADLQEGRPDPIWLLPVDPSPTAEQQNLQFTFSEGPTGTDVLPSGPPRPIWLLPLTQDITLALPDVSNVMQKPPVAQGPAKKHKLAGKTQTGIKPLGTPSLILEQQRASDPTNIGQGDFIAALPDQPSNDQLAKDAPKSVGSVESKVQQKALETQKGAIAAASKNTPNSRPLGPKKTPNADKDRGVPISMSMFQQWGA